MRRYLLALPFLIACGGSEVPPADSAAMAAPMTLTDADIAGTWTGTTIPEGSDSVVSQWTQVCGGGSCRGTSSSAPNDTVVATYTLQADSSVGVTAPFADTTIVKGAMLIDRWVARLSGNQVTGTGQMTLADRPDSVVLRYRFTGARVP